MNQITNQLTTRAELMSSILNIGKDINSSCGYPTFITINNYKLMFDREGAAKRVVNLLPEGCWSKDPEIIEGDEAKETKFEKAWIDLEKKHRIYHFLQRTDTLSGIGRFGIMLIGVDDGLELNEPIASINEITGERIGKGDGTGLNLLYLRVFDESLVDVRTKEPDTSSPRFGFPKSYNIQFEDRTQIGTTSTSSSTSTTKEVHWTRVLHLADNRESSEIYGIPRMKPVYNRLLDIRKVLSGSAEMFWKGAFPGYVFEINSDVKNPVMDTDSIRTEFQNYSSDLQRYLAVEGVSVKALAPQVADPSNHLKSQIENIALTIGVPLRIFLGSEQAKLASTQDKETWNDRLENRQNKYVSPMVLRPFVDRLIAMGILEEAEYTIKWSDLNSPTDEDKAKVGEVRTNAIAKYVVSGADVLIPPMEFLTLILGMTRKEAEVIEESSSKFAKLEEEEEEPNGGNNDGED